MHWNNSFHEIIGPKQFFYQIIPKQNSSLNLLINENKNYTKTFPGIEISTAERKKELQVSR